MFYLELDFTLESILKLVSNEFLKLYYGLIENVKTKTP